MRFTMNTLIVSLLSLVAIAYIAGCDRSFDKKPKNYSDALILLPKATEVRYYELGGSFQLTYKIATEYPAADLIATISNQLKQGNWQPLKEDYLNPGLSSSHVRGWTSFQDGTKKPPQIVHQWLADWENQAGEVVRYGFRYQYESGKTKDLKDLAVIAIFMPASLAKQTREKALEFTKKHHNAEKTK
jgi:hypothetical protein